MDAVAVTEDADLKAGAKMIIALQAMAGIKESEEDAEAGWLGMSPAERRTTREVYALLFPKEAKSCN